MRAGLAPTLPDSSSFLLGMTSRATAKSRFFGRKLPQNDVNSMAPTRNNRTSDVSNPVSTKPVVRGARLRA